MRERRKELGLKQRDLATALGIASQQIHKYEKGIDRLPASWLMELSTVLSLPLSSFYEGLEGHDKQEKELMVTCLNKQGKKFTLKLLDEEGIISDLQLLEKEQ